MDPPTNPFVVPDHERAPPAPAGRSVDEREDHPLAVPSLVLAIITALLCSPLLLVAVVMAHLAIARTRSDPARYRPSRAPVIALCIAYPLIALGLVALFLFYGQG